MTVTFWINVNIVVIVYGRHKALSDTHCPGIRAASVDVAGPGCWTASSGCPLAATEASSPGKRSGRSHSGAAAFCAVHGSSETKPGKITDCSEQLEEKRQCQLWTCWEPIRNSSCIMTPRSKAIRHMRGISLFWFRYYSKAGMGKLQPRWSEANTFTFLIQRAELGDIKRHTFVLMLLFIFTRHMWGGPPKHSAAPFVLALDPLSNFKTDCGSSIQKVAQSCFGLQWNPFLICAYIKLALACETN